jgi:hypothetical protein
MKDEQKECKGRGVQPSPPMMKMDSEYQVSNNHPHYSCEEADCDERPGLVAI